MSLYFSIICIHGKHIIVLVDDKQPSVSNLHARSPFFTSVLSITFGTILILDPFTIITSQNLVKPVVPDRPILKEVQWFNSLSRLNQTLIKSVVLINHGYRSVYSCRICSSHV